MITPAQHAEIRRLYFGEHWKVGTIAAALGVHHDTVRAAIAPLVEGHEAMDVMVLACTHFPLLAHEIAAAFPTIVQVDGGPGIARRIAWLTRDQWWPDQPTPGIALFTAPPPPTPRRPHGKPWTRPA